MERIYDACDLSIRRACGFAALAIFTLMAGLSYHPFVAIRFGTMATFVLIAVLVVKGVRAPRRPYRNTEAWLLLGRRHGLPEDRAQQTIGGMLRARYFWYATVASAVALAMGAIELYLALFGHGPLPD